MSSCEHGREAFDLTRWGAAVEALQPYAQGVALRIAAHACSCGRLSSDWRSAAYAERGDATRDRLREALRQVAHVRVLVSKDAEGRWTLNPPAEAAEPVDVSGIQVHRFDSNTGRWDEPVGVLDYLARRAA